MNQVLKGSITINRLIEEMEKNKADEITRIIFLPKSNGIIISFNINERGNN